MIRTWNVECSPFSDKYVLMLWLNDKAYTLNITKEFAKALGDAYTLECLIEQDCINENARLKSENAALREQLKDYEQIESRKNRISKHRHEDAQLVADKIARCGKCEYKGTSVEIDDIGKIEICKCPPYKGKWIEEIEQCPKEENITEERKDDGKGN